MKTSELTMGKWNITCSESVIDPLKMWTVYSLSTDLQPMEIASAIYNYSDAKAIQSIPEMLALLESFVAWYPEINERLNDAENAIFKIMVERATKIIDK